MTRFDQSSPVAPRGFTVAIGPVDDPDVADLARMAGAAVCPIANLDRADALIWTQSDGAGFPQDLPDSVRWIQLPSAGVEEWIAAGVLDGDRAWTTTAGAYAPQVAEHAIAILLAGLRSLPDALRSRTWQKSHLADKGRTLRGARVGIYGAGGIGRAIIPMLTGLGASAVAINRTGEPVPGAEETIAAADASSVWGAVDHLILAAPATSVTHHLVGYAELAALRDDAWLVNIARGSLIDQDALRRALDQELIAGAALDVADPEPLPEGHWLFDHPRVVLTPHVANPVPLLRAALRERIHENLTRFSAGQNLLGLVDLERGY